MTARVLVAFLLSLTVGVPAASAIPPGPGLGEELTDLEAWKKARARNVTRQERISRSPTPWPPYRRGQEALVPGGLKTIEDLRNLGNPLDATWRKRQAIFREALRRKYTAEQINELLGELAQAGQEDSHVVQSELPPGTVLTDMVFMTADGRITVDEAVQVVCTGEPTWFVPVTGVGIYIPASCGNATGILGMTEAVEVAEEKPPEPPTEPKPSVIPQKPAELPPARPPLSHGPPAVAKKRGRGKLIGVIIGAVVGGSAAAFLSSGDDGGRPARKHAGDPGPGNDIN